MSYRPVRTFVVVAPVAPAATAASCSSTNPVQPRHDSSFQGFGAGRAKQ